MSRKKIKPENKKIKFSITIDPILFNELNKLYDNKSKYIEKLIEKDLTLN
jgi:hypothetical protein